MCGWRVHARVSRDPVPPEAPIVVLVHGLGVSSRYMLPAARALAPHYRVYAPDLPGFGRSSKSRQALTVSELADALAAWMGRVGIGRAALIGNSMGCQIIADFALRYPARLTRAILLGPTMDPRARTARQQIWRLLIDSTREPPAQPFVVIASYLRAGPLRTWRTLQHALRDPIEDKLPRMAVPTIVMRGSRDPIVPQEWAEEATRLLPRGRLVIVRGAAHTINYGAPEALLRVVRPFLEADRQPG